MHTPSSVSDLVERAVRLDNGAFQQFLATVYHERALQRAHLLPKEEADLLKKINAGFPIRQWERLDALDSKMEAGIISEAEHQELTGLVDAYERYTLRRLKYLSRLAALRQVTLREVMKQLGIKHESDV